MFGKRAKKADRNLKHTAVTRAASVACEPLENRTMFNVVIHPVFGTEPQTQDNGTRLSDPPVYLIFWGSYWGGTGSPRAVAVENAAANVMNSAYPNTYSQYGVSTHPHLAMSVYDSSNPSNGFTPSDLDNVIQNQIDNGPLPEYDDTPTSGMYVVVTPPGISSNAAGAGGYNTEGSDYDFPFDFDNHIPEIWVSSSASSVDRFSLIFSHELAESSTDSGGNGIEFSPGASWTGGGEGNQIGDFEPNAYSFREPDGVLVQPLWSRADHAITVDNGTSQQFDLFPIWSGTSFTGQYNLVVNGDQHANHADFVSVGETASGGVSVTLNADTTFFDPGRIAHVQINSGDGADNIFVQQTVVSTNIVSAGLATVHVGGGANMQGITAPLNIENPASFTNVILNDGADTAARTAFMFTRGANPVDSQGNSDPWGEVSGLSPAPVSFEYDDISGITVDTNGGGGTFTVQDTVKPTNIVGNAVTTINVGNSGGVQGITGTLNIENPPTFNTINIDDSGDNTARTVTLATLGTNSADSEGDSDSWGQITGLAPAAINYEYRDTSSLTVKTGSGGDTINVNATVVRTSIVGHSAGGGPDDTINVGNGTVQNIVGALSLENPTGFDVIKVNDNSDGVARTVTLSTLGTNSGDSQGNNDPWGQIVGLAPASISYEYDDARSLGVTLGVGGNTVNVKATGVPTTLVGGAVPLIIVLGPAHIANPIIIPPLLHGGPDTINVTDGGSTQNINAPLTIQNAWGQDPVTVDDSADATARTVTLSTAPPAGDSDPFGTISGLSPAPITYEAADVSSLAVDGGSGGNTFNVAGTPTWTVGGSGGTPITLNTGAGADTVNLSGQGAGTTLTVNGQGGNDTLQVIGSGAADTFALTAGQVAHGTSVANYSSVENLTLDPGTFNVTNDLGGIALSALGASTGVNFESSQTLAALTVNAAGALVTAGGANVLNVNSLSLGGGAKLDLRDNSMQVHYGAGSDPMAAIRSWMVSGYAGGAFNGAGLNTGSADGQHGLGYADSADGVVAGLAAHTVLVKYALYGDANLDGHVDFNDLLMEAQNYGKNPGASMWDQGDTNYDGNVNFNDLLKMAQDYGL